VFGQLGRDSYALCHDFVGNPIVRAYDHPRSDHVEMFAAFGRAVYYAQGFESLVLVNLQYSLALDHSFADLNAVDTSADEHGSIPLGQLASKLAGYLKDDALSTEVKHAISTRNALVHHFFATRTAGIVMTHTETTGAISWILAASEEFTRVSRKLEARWEAMRLLWRTTRAQ
jgi:hypothetical protein